MPSIRYVPELAVIDDEIDITVDDLECNQAVTVSAAIVHVKVLYIGFGHFYSDYNGRVNLKRDVSYGGTYSGLQPMGIFSSMLAMPSKQGCPRLLVRGSAEEILKHRISVWKGHLTQDQVHQLHMKYLTIGTFHPVESFFQRYVLCQCEIKRTYLSPDVHRTPIEVNFKGETICGILFLPKGKGPFPGVIDMFGGAGGCIEIRAALLAKHGYATLALAYFAYEGLKAKSWAELKMTYFDKAIEWFSQQPTVASGGISLVGVCLGAQIVLTCSVRNASVRSSICINSNMVMTPKPTVSNPLFDYFTAKELSERNLSEIWRGHLSSKMGDPPKLSRPVIHTDHDNPILFIVGDHDPYPECVDDVIDQLKRSGKKNVFKRVIVGQGHLIEPPYMPLCVASPSPNNLGHTDEYNQLIDYVPYDWNGDHKKHGESQIEAWKVLLDFLHDHFTCCLSSKL